MPIIRIAVLVTTIVFVFSSTCLIAKDFDWPEGKKIAISLTYDDAVASQLNNVVPSLNKYDFNASFYVVPASEDFRKRFDEWAVLPSQGHELGNHSLYHGCSRKLVGDWVAKHLDLDERTVEDLVMEIKVANILLRAIDGNEQRTFTIPCGNEMVRDGNYVEKVIDEFIAVKGQEVESGFATFLAPSGQSGKELINFVKSTPKNAKLVNMLFHGVGEGDSHPLKVTKQAHDELLEYLAANQDKYWVDSYLNIMTHVNHFRAQNDSN